MSITTRARDTLKVSPDAYALEWPSNDWFFNGLTHDVLNGDNEYERAGKPPRAGRLRRAAALLGSIVGNTLRTARDTAQEKIRAVGRGLSRAGSEIVLGAAEVVISAQGKHTLQKGDATVEAPHDFAPGQRRHATEHFGDVRKFGNSVMTVEVLRDSLDLQDAWASVHEMNSRAAPAQPTSAAPVLEPRLAM